MTIFPRGPHAAWIALGLWAGLSSACGGAAPAVAGPSAPAVATRAPDPALHRAVSLLSLSLVQDRSQPDDSVETITTTLFPEGMALVSSTARGSREQRFRLRNLRVLRCLLNRAVTFDDIDRKNPPPPAPRPAARWGGAGPSTVLRFERETRSVQRDLGGLSFLGLAELGAVPTRDALPTRPATLHVLVDPAMRAFFYGELDARLVAKYSAHEVARFVEVLRSETHGLCQGGSDEQLKAAFASIPEQHFDLLMPLLSRRQTRGVLIPMIPVRRPACDAWTRALERAATSTLARGGVALALDQMAGKVAGEALSRLLERFGEPRDTHQLLLYAGWLKALKAAKAKTILRGPLQASAVRLLSAKHVDPWVGWVGAIAREQRAAGATPDLEPLAQAQAIRALADGRWQVRVAGIYALDSLYLQRDLPPELRERLGKLRSDRDPCVAAYAQALLTTRSYPAGAGDADCQVNPLTADFGD